jgi:hypothetical protein
VPGSPYTDDREGVPPGSRVIRRINGRFVDWDKGESSPPRIRSQAIQFYDAELAAKFGCPGPALSVIVESLVPSIEELVAKYSDDGLAYLEVDLIRGENGEQGIQLWPRDDEPAHAVVFRTDGGRDLRGSLKKTLAEHLTANWISLPERYSEGP